jgi:hypothetical protein
MSRLTQFCLALSQHLSDFTSTRLLALFFLALALTWTISRGEVTAEVLFQSPESPLPEPVPVEQEFVPEAPPVEEVVPEPAPVEEVVPVAPVEPEIPVEPPPVEEVVPVEPQPELVQPQAEPGNTFESPVPSLPAPDQQAGAPAAPEPPSRRVDPEDRQIEDDFEEAGDANFILDRAEFIDTMVVSTAYVWLCCGIVIFLMIPLVFLFLQIRGRTKMSRENIY